MIERVLVANRGEIARRIFRTCRAMGLDTVAVFSDADAGEPHVTEADQALRLPGTTARETYLNMEAILAAAKEAAADAIHPGYGFLAENPGFARAVDGAGLTWIGPSPRAIEIMGSKLASKALMGSVGVPILPGFDIAGLSVPHSAAEALGFPVLVKASAGGGGKGMRVVADPDDLPEAIAGARREAAGAFGDDTVFLEKFLPTPRHIEIQVFGDTQGNIVSLFERECSIQRRHQKIIEESPSPAVDDVLRSRMGEAAVDAARAVDYVGAGTVEFLYQDGQFFFLEMNTRLQVEHPVTEAVTGLDLVRLQIEVADGEPLPPEALRPTLNGHAIEARLYAEDPLNDFLPVTGRFHRFEFEGIEGLRVDSGIESGSDVSIHYDPMLAKVIARSGSRDEAAATLAAALRAAAIHGSTTNRSLLVRVLESDEFIRGETDTRFLDRHDLAELAGPLAGEEDEALAARAAALADQADERSGAPVLATIPTGWRNSFSQAQHRAYRGEHAVHHVTYSLDGSHVVFAGEDHADLIQCTPHVVEFTRSGSDYRFHVARYGEIRHVDSATVPAQLFEVPRFPPVELDDDAGSLHAPMPGRIIRVGAMVGDVVREGQVLVVLEAMKMEHAIRSPLAGTVSRVNCRPGEQVEAGAILVVVEERPGEG